MRTLCDAYYEEHESHYRAFLDISDYLILHSYYFIIYTSNSVNSSSNFIYSNNLRLEEYIHLTPLIIGSPWASQ